MGLVNKFKNITGVVNVQIEGFFTERFINLCKINNLKIWDIRTIVKGVIRFNISASDFKKLRKVAKKTKCKITIKNKKGLYFTFFKYRKRKIIIFLCLFALIFSVILSTFVLRIEVVGNDKIETTQIITALKKSGLYIGKNKLFLEKKEVVNSLRLNISDISWAGIDISGTKAVVRVVEKTRLADKDIQNNQVGDIVASKSGIITKIVPENGTAKFKTGSYINKGDVAIEGTIYSKFMDPQKVTAKGILKISSEYIFEKKYEFNQKNIEYTNKKLYTIGIGIDSKENMLRYFSKNKSYDIKRNSKVINIFGKSISFDFYTCLEYVENEVNYTKDEILELANLDIDCYLNDEILSKCVDGRLIQKDIEVNDCDNGINIKVVYLVEEEVGEFVQIEGG